MQGYAQTMGGPFMFVNMEMPLSSYQQGRPTEEVRGGGPGITFGSTPVVSVRAHVGGEEEVADELVNPTGKIPSTPNSRPSASSSVPFMSPSVNPLGPQAAAPSRPQAQQLEQQHPPRQTLPEQTAPLLTPPSSVVVPPKAVRHPPHQPVPGVAPTSAPVSQSTIKSDQISSKKTPNVPVVVEPAAPVEASSVEPSVQVKEEAPQPEPSKSWASLFAGKIGTEGGPDAASKPTAVISPFSPGPPGSPSKTGEKSVVPSGDQALGAFLRDYALKHSPAPIIPRGLTNRSNWCFVNAILQALLACPPLHNLLRALACPPLHNLL